MYKRQVQTADEIEEQTGEEPIQMVEQAEKPEPEKITGSVEMNAIMVMLQGMKEIKGSIESLKEENNKKRQEDKVEIIKSLKEDNNKNRWEDKEKLDKNIESLRKDRI